MANAECIHHKVGKVKIEMTENPFEKARRIYDLIVAT
jgi:hypothetical protein